MKKLVFSACALTLTGAAIANDSDMAQLDQDVQALSASLQGLEGTGLNIGGRIRANYASSSDVTVGGNDLGGFNLMNARLYAEGTTGSNIGYRFEQDFATGNLLDAYLDIPVGNDITVRAGRFRADVLRESQIDTGDLFFFDRSQHAAAFAGRTNGVAVRGNFDAFDWGVTISNGSDGTGDDLFYSVRAGFDFLGEGTGMVEGAYGASEEMVASAGVAYFNDDSVDDSDGIAIEASLATSQFSVQAVILDLGDAVSGSQVDFNDGTGVALFGLGPVADSTPFSIQGTFMLTQPSSDYGAWEIGARLQDLDTGTDTRVIDIGANYYVDGHNMKYIINWTSIDDDNTDGDLIRVGVQTRF